MKSDIAKNHHSRWTKQQVETLKQLVKNGSNSSQIAIALGRTRASVMGKKSAMGIEERIQRGTNSSHTAPLILSHKKSSSSLSQQQEIPFEKPQATQVSSLESLVTQLQTFAKKSGLRVTVSFEN